MNICIQVNLGCISQGGKKPKKVISDACDKAARAIQEEELRERRIHSLKYMPVHGDDVSYRQFLDGSPKSSILASFRLGNAGLGNRDTPSIKVCPACNMGPNNELHLVFECKALEGVRRAHSDTLNEAQDQKHFNTEDPRKLASFLGGDFSNREQLMKRAALLESLLIEFNESTKMQRVNVAL